MKENQEKHVDNWLYYIEHKAGKRKKQHERKEADT
jgi:hypothetical protein